MIDATTVPLIAIDLFACMLAVGVNTANNAAQSSGAMVAKKVVNEVNAVSINVVSVCITIHGM